MYKLVLHYLRPLFLIFVIFSSMELCAYENDEEPDVKDLEFKERIFVGGYLGLQFGGYTFVEVSPLVGYRLTNRIDAGIGLNYQYSKVYIQETGTNTFGWSSFMRFSVLPQVFVHGEYEILNYETLASGEQSSERSWEHNYFLGAGYRLRIGEKAFFNLMLLYNFNQNSQVYFDDFLIFRFSIEVGL